MARTQENRPYELDSNPMNDANGSRRTRHLGWLLVPPSVWAIHFLASYLTIAIWCVKLSATTVDTTPARVAVGIYTAIALLLIGWVGSRSYNQHRRGDRSLPHDDDTPGDQRRFVGYATFLLAALSATAVVFTTLVVVFVRSCD